MNLSELKLNPRNPRTITKEKLIQLEKSLKEFGDLGGIIFNRKTKMLVGGHQRSKIFDDAKITIEKTFLQERKLCC